MAVRTYTVEQRDRRRARRHEWRAAMSPAERVAHNRKNSAEVRRIKYGITDEDYARMLVDQNGHCALCPKTPLENRNGRLFVDHCHETKVVRGLLCSACNRAIALLGDNAEGLRRALEYLTCQA